MATQPRLLDNRDVRPTQPVPVVLTDRVLTVMPWGMTPSWSSKPLFNARAEGLDTKPSFRRLLPRQRCLIPASAFFEWAGGTSGAKSAKTKYRIARRDGDLFAFAGLYSIRPASSDPSDGELHECTIITTSPNRVLAPIHNRMPVMLLPDDEERWLDPDLTEPEEILRFLVPYPDELLEAHAA
jgi:putative SOS response-associated peptidase YedK